jgi:malate synthase
MKTAADPFRERLGSGWTPSGRMTDPDSFPVRIEVPAGPITLEGTRRNARMLIEYVEGWLNGRGAKGIDSLEGKPGIHPALMEDLATGRMSVAQIAQRIRHAARTTEGPAATHDFALVKRLLQEELQDILDRRPADAALQARYRKAVKIAMRWIKNYTELDFTSLGAYARPELEAIAAAPDAF